MSQMRQNERKEASKNVATKKNKILSMFKYVLETKYLVYVPEEVLSTFSRYLKLPPPPLGYGPGHWHRGWCDLTADGW